MKEAGARMIPSTSIFALTRIFQNMKIEKMPENT
jgi:hypothetical protein